MLTLHHPVGVVPYGSVFPKQNHRRVALAGRREAPASGHESLPLQRPGHRCLTDGWMKTMKTMNTWQSFNRGERTPGWHHDQLHLQRGQ